MFYLGKWPAHLRSSPLGEARCPACPSWVRMRPAARSERTVSFRAGREFVARTLRSTKLDEALRLGLNHGKHRASAYRNAIGLGRELPLANEHAILLSGTGPAKHKHFVCNAGDKRRRRI